ncbi:MAG: FecR family protein [Cyclobacteriaceae bacterium]
MKEVKKHLIIKFLRRKCSPEEANQVMKWMHGENFDQELLNEIENDLKSQLLGNGEADSESLQHIYKEILLRNDLEKVEEQRKIRQLSQSFTSRSIGFFARIAAAVALLFTATYFFSQEIELAEESVITAEKTIKENSKGRKSTIFLSDGTIVNLNADSQIEYYEAFTDTIRVVYLQGEAFFDVAKDTLRPFMVISDYIQVTAMGTSFNVQSFADTPTSTVALATGKVEINSVYSDQRVLLKPGQKVNFKKKISEFSAPAPFSAKAEFGWKEGILFFRKADMNTVINQLERWYGVEIITKNFSQGWSYTGEFHNQSLKSVMESLSFSQNFNYEITEKEVIIRFE